MKNASASLARLTEVVCIVQNKAEADYMKQIKSVDFNKTIAKFKGY